MPLFCLGWFYGSLFYSVIYIFSISSDKNEIFLWLVLVSLVLLISGDNAQNFSFGISNALKIWTNFLQQLVLKVWSLYYDLSFPWEQGQASEWALLRRHLSEDLFGVQICGAYPDTVSRVVELIDQECSVDFIDINMGCPIDIVVNKAAGSALLTKPMRIKSIIQAASSAVDTPITVKVGWTLSLISCLLWDHGCCIIFLKFTSLSLTGENGLFWREKPHWIFGLRYRFLGS